jgi:mono/diheme cytochrome c family protein
MTRTIALGFVLALALVPAACSKSDDTSNTASTADNAAATAASSAPVAAATSSSASSNTASASDGAGVYTTNCSSCHQTNGAGVPGAFPPLALNPVVNGDPSKLIHIVKYGLSGKVMVNGQAYDGTMPNWGQSLSDAQIASVVTYVRASWGNKASAVSAADVSAVSK